MEENFSESFVRHWNQIVMIWADIAVVLAAVIFLLYVIRRSMIRKRTAKYAFINANEIKYYWYSALMLSMGFAFYLNGLIVREDNTSTEFLLIIKTCLSLGIGFIVAYFFNTYLNVYYPFRLEKKLHSIRFAPRWSPDGNEMKILTEDEEDVHLTEEMIHHEDISAFEYDVWIDEKTGFKIIDKYLGSSYDLVCENCNYRTLREVHEEVVTEPTQTESGVLLQHLKCSYCDHEEERETKIAPLGEYAED